LQNFRRFKNSTLVKPLLIDPAKPPGLAAQDPLQQSNSRIFCKDRSHTPKIACWQHVN